MTRIYPREEIKWDLDTLQALAALDPPQATYFEKADRWVVKQDGQSFAVRPEQIVDAQDYDEGPDPMVAYERYLEDGGPHAAAIAAEDEIEQRMEAMDVDLQEMRAQRAAYERAVAPAGTEFDELINHFL